MTQPFFVKLYMCEPFVKNGIFRRNQEVPYIESESVERLLVLVFSKRFVDNNKYKKSALSLNYRLLEEYFIRIVFRL